MNDLSLKLISLEFTISSRISILWSSHIPVCKRGYDWQNDCFIVLVGDIFDDW